MTSKIGMYSTLKNNTRACAWVLAGALAATSAFAQQKTGPSITDDDSLTWHGITLYGVIDLGLQYDTHSAPFTPYRPAASGNIVRSNSNNSVFGVTPSNMGQTRVGIQGNEPLVGDVSAVFQIETFFNPQSGEIANSLKSLAVNNGVALNQQTVNVDGSSAGQAFQTAWVGLSSRTYGALTFGRQLTLLSDGTITYDPNYNATAFGLIGASNTYSGGGTSEDNRLDQVVKYRLAPLDDLFHVGAMYKFNGSTGSSQTVFQADLGAKYAGASIDALYSKENSAITGAALSASQVADLPTLGYSITNSLSATISDNTTFALMGLYQFDPLKFFAGFERIKYANPYRPLNAGYTDIGGYVLAFVNNTAYDKFKYVNVYWTGVRYSILPELDLVAAYYGYNQNSYATGKSAFCENTSKSSCSGSLDAFSFDADYHLTKRFDVYAGAMYSGAHNGVASGYLHSTNINPTIGGRFKF